MKLEKHEVEAISLYLLDLCQKIDIRFRIEKRDIEALYQPDTIEFDIYIGTNQIFSINNHVILVWVAYESSYKWELVETSNLANDEDLIIDAIKSGMGYKCYEQPNFGF